MKDFDALVKENGYIVGCYTSDVKADAFSWKVVNSSNVGQWNHALFRKTVAQSRLQIPAAVAA